MGLAIRTGSSGAKRTHHDLLGSADVLGEDAGLLACEMQRRVAPLVCELLREGAHDGGLAALPRRIQREVRLTVDELDHPRQAAGRRDHVVVLGATGADGVEAAHDGAFSTAFEAGASHLRSDVARRPGLPARSDRAGPGRTKPEEGGDLEGGDEQGDSVRPGASVLARTSRSARPKSSVAARISPSDGPPTSILARISRSDGPPASFLATIQRSARPSAPVSAKIPLSARSDHEIPAAPFSAGASRP